MSDRPVAKSDDEPDGCPCCGEADGEVFRELDGTRYTRCPACGTHYTTPEQERRNRKIEARHA